MDYQNSLGDCLLYRLQQQKDIRLLTQELSTYQNPELAEFAMLGNAFVCKKVGCYVIAQADGARDIHQSGTCGQSYQKPPSEVGAAHSQHVMGMSPEFLRSRKNANTTPSTIVAPTEIIEN